MASLPQDALKARAHYIGVAFSMEELDKIPHLKALASHIRELLKSTNKYLRDKNFQNKVDYENFIALLHSDLIFRLKVTQQYYLLQSLFKDPLERARWMAFLDEVRAEEEREHNQQQQLIIQQDNLTLTKMHAQKETLGSEQMFSNWDEDEFNQTLLDWTHPAPHLTNVQKLQHYENELQRITLVQHTQIIRLRNDAITSDIQDGTGFIDKMITALTTNHPEKTEVIKELKAIKAEVRNRRQEIMSTSILGANGLDDASATAQHKDKALEALQGFCTYQINVLMSGRQDLHLEVTAVLTDRAEDVGRNEEMIRALNEVCEEQQTQIMSHIEQAKRAVMKEQAVANLNAIINLAKESGVEEHQRERRTNSIIKLENYQTLLAKTEDLAAVQSIIQDCKSELAKLEEILPEPEFEKIKTEAAALENMVIEPNWIQPPPLASEHTDVDIAPSQNLDNASVAEEHHSVSSDADVRHSEQNRQNVGLAGLPTFFSRPPNIVPSEGGIRLGREVRERYTDGVRPPGSSEEKQRKAAFEDITSQSEEIVNDEDATEKQKRLANNILVNITQINEFPNYEACPEDVKNSFRVNLVALSEMNEAFSDIKEKYAHLFELSTTPAVTSP
ncbi:MAG: hypothetical protein ACRCXC_02475 [Legionella sp.]